MADNSSPEKKIAKAIPELVKHSMRAIKRGEPESLSSKKNHEDARSILIDTMNKIGCDPDTMAKEFKNALEMAKTTGKVYHGKNGEPIIIPDLNAYKNLLMLWGAWTGAGRQSATNIGNATFNFTGGLDEASKRRVTGLIELLEGEVKRRGLSDVRAEDIEPEDAEALPGVVESSAGQEEAAD